MRLRFAALAAVATLVLAGCATAGSAAPDDAAPPGKWPIPIVVAEPEVQLPATVTDAAGAEVTVTDSSRIVALNGGIAETLVALGMRHRIVGREVSADFDEVKDVPLVSNGHDISPEGLLALQPTVVIGDARSGPPEAMAAISNAGVPVVIVPEVWSLKEAPLRTTAIAAAVGAPAAGTALNDYLAAQIAKLAPADAGKPKPVVAFLYLRGTAAVYMLGGKGSGADDLIAAAGGTDAGSKAGLDQFTPLTPEALASSAPDVILVMEKGLDSVGGIDGLAALPGVAQTPAGQQRNVVSLPDGMLLSFGPRSAQTVQFLADAIS